MKLNGTHTQRFWGDSLIDKNCFVNCICILCNINVILILNSASSPIYTLYSKNEYHEVQKLRVTLGLGKMCSFALSFAFVLCQYILYLYIIKRNFKCVVNVTYFIEWSEKNVYFLSGETINETLIVHFMNFNFPFIIYNFVVKTITF